MSKKVIVIGAGFAGLTAATELAAKGCAVTLLEKNATPGGRARKFEAQGFSFDMGPSWYWMPDVFEKYFARFGKKVEDYYELKRLDPSYAIFFDEQHVMEVPAGLDAIEKMFEQYEPGSSKKLRQFLQEAQYKYEVGMEEFVYKPGHSFLEFADRRVLQSMFRLQLFTSISKHLKQLFSNEYLLKMLEFPVLFLGATPENTPAMYSLMNYADLALGTWYPMGGMHKIIEAMVSLATEKGVQIKCNQEVVKIETAKGWAKSVYTTDAAYVADIVVAGADYHHVEQKLLSAQDRHYKSTYWQKRTMAPSSLLFYLGVNKRLNNLQHHNLFFDTDFKKHAYEIYEAPKWPSEPLFYVCCPSVTDDSVAPTGCENLFILIPLAPDLKDSEQLRMQYYDKVMDRLEKLTGQAIKEHVIYQRSFAMQDFEKEYHAYKGNAYGLANTLRQTAFLKPKLRSPKISNLFFTGQLTTPGPGVPPSIISGQVVASEVVKAYQLSVKNEQRNV